MKCETCGNDKQIIDTITRVEGDNSPTTTTEIYNDFRTVCVNQHCSAFGWPGWKPKTDADRPDMKDVRLTTTHSVKIFPL